MSGYEKARSVSLSVRDTVLILSISCVTVGFDAAQLGSAWGQDRKASAQSSTGAKKQFVSVKQMPLTDKHILGLLAATAEINSITDNVPENINELRPETIAKLNAAARKNGLASHSDYKTIDANVGLVMSGYDEVTKTYVGRDALIKLRIARVKANRTMSVQDRNDELTKPNDQLQFAMPTVEYAGNIALVSEYYGRLQASARGD